MDETAAVEPVEEITVDISELTFGDLEAIFEWQEGRVDIRTMVPLLDRIVVGGVKQRKFLAELPKIAEAIALAIGGSANPPGKAGQGN